MSLLLEEIVAAMKGRELAKFGSIIVSPRPESFHLTDVAPALIERDLNCGFQSLLIVKVKFGEFEWLLNPGDWGKHFGGAED